MDAPLISPSSGGPGDNRPQLNHLKIEVITILLLQLLPRRVRRHAEKQQRKLRRSIRKYGQILPIVIDDDNRIIDGEAIYMVMLDLGYEEINVVRVSHLSDAQLRTLRLALNRIQQDAVWDDENLALEFQDLLELDIDLSITGFDAPEIDFSFSVLEDQTPNEQADQLPTAGEIVERVSLGDVWICGDHILICGDATQPNVYGSLWTFGTPRMMIPDIPFNVPIDGHVCGKGSIKHAEFAMASGEMSEAEFTEFIRQFLEASMAIMPDGSLLYIFIDWRHTMELQTAARLCGLVLVNMCVWRKTNAGMGSLYRSQHELIFIFKKGNAPHLNNVELGKHGRNRTNVWDYPSVNSNDPSRKGDLTLHPTVKPVQLVADAILDVTARQDWVLDPFGGSGTTMLAAEQTGRRAMLVEIDPHYCDVTLARFEAMTGVAPINIGTIDNFTGNEPQSAANADVLLLPPPTSKEGPEHG